jgi:hypothetical protein
VDEDIVADSEEEEEEEEEEELMDEDIKLPLVGDGNGFVCFDDAIAGIVLSCCVGTAKAAAAADEST